MPLTSLAIFYQFLCIFSALECVHPLAWDAFPLPFSEVFRKTSPLSSEIHHHRLFLSLIVLFNSLKILIECVLHVKIIEVVNS